MSTDLPIPAIDGEVIGEPLGHNITKRDEKGRIVKGCGGRPKGTKNRYTINMMDAVGFVFGELGGEQGLLDWVKKSEVNKAAFYSWAMKLLPNNIKLDTTEPLQVTIHRVIKKDGDCD